MPVQVHFSLAFGEMRPVFCFCIISCFLQVIYCDWETEWMGPVQEKLHLTTDQGSFHHGDDVMKPREEIISREETSTSKIDTLSSQQYTSQSNSEKIKSSLKLALDAATTFMENLRGKILATEAREKSLKEVIANGRLGLTTVVVKTQVSPPRTYMVRDGHWTQCDGVMHLPSSRRRYNQDLPKCLGEEMLTVKDSCVFNSLIKYEVVPTSRMQLYTEDDYLCLKSNFNTTLEQYLSVPKKVIGDTCNGEIRTLDENIKQCGSRILVEYIFYPDRNENLSVLPMEYCTERDGACKLTVAWNLSSRTMENYEFMKNEKSFPKHFLDTSPINDHESLIVGRKKYSYKY